MPKVYLFWYISCGTMDSVYIFITVNSKTIMGYVFSRIENLIIYKGKHITVKPYVKATDRKFSLLNRLDTLNL